MRMVFMMRYPLGLRPMMREMLPCVVQRLRRKRCRLGTVPHIGSLISRYVRHVQSGFPADVATVMMVITDGAAGLRNGNTRRRLYPDGNDGGRRDHLHLGSDCDAELSGPDCQETDRRRRAVGRPRKIPNC